MNDRTPTPAPQMVPLTASQPFQAPERRQSGPVDIVKLTMPLRWVTAIVIAVAGGVFSIGAVLSRTEGHIADHAAHLSPDVSAAGGVVTRRDLRRVLRAMQIRCTPGPGGGLACTVEIPTEAD